MATSYAAWNTVCCVVASRYLAAERPVKFIKKKEKKKKKKRKRKAMKCQDGILEAQTTIFLGIQPWV
jgi:hypothetical protein